MDFEAHEMRVRESLEARMAELEAHIVTYRAQLDSTLQDRALIIAERDRTFALMLARAETAEARGREQARNAIADARDWSPYPAGSPESAAWIRGATEMAERIDAAIRALIPGKETP